MKSTLPATHLLRHFLLFVLTAIFLLTVLRAGYALWQYPKIEQTNAFPGLFVQGFRFDLALIGIILFIPVTLGSLLSMGSSTRILARFLITFFLVAGLALILALELFTPWFIESQGLRPDFALLGSVPSPMETLIAVVTEHMIPSAIAAVLVLLIMIAFWSRMEMQRFLRYKVSTTSALLMALLGGLVCLMAIWSTPDLLGNPALSPAQSVISEDATVNDLVMNSTYKSLYSTVQPFLK